MIRRIYLVRHGITMDWEAGRYQSASSELSKLGIQQAQRLAERFRANPPKLIVSSTMRRALQTANILQMHLDVPAISAPFIHELLRPAATDGKSRHDQTARKIMDEVHENFELGRGPCHGEEFFDEFLNRGACAVSDFEHAENETLFVTHGHLIRMVLGIMMHRYKMRPHIFSGLVKFLRPENTGITTCDFDTQTKQWELVDWNDVRHLEGLKRM